ncbi:MAG: serine hydrolase [Leptospiraceae bacterium]|nr:serine hydrolase [Leptospiraceae bacterium]
MIISKNIHILCSIIFFSFSCVYPENKIKEKTILADSYILIHLESNQRILEKNTKEVYPVASITKLITAILSKKFIKSDDSISVPNIAVVKNNYESKAGLKSKQKFSLSNLLHALIIPSGNDAARTLEHKINEKHNFRNESQKILQELKMKDSNFEEAVGTSSNSKSSSEDLIIILKYIAQNHSDLIEIMKLEKGIIKSFDGDRLEFDSRNKIHDYEGFQIYGKTGTTKKAGQCFAGFIQKGKERWLLVLLGSKDYVKDIKTMVKSI